MNAQAIYEGLREEDPNRQVFQLTRSGFAGLQRYATATWSGDIATRWEDMKAQISAGLNFAMSGIPYWTISIVQYGIPLIAKLSPAEIWAFISSQRVAISPLQVAVA